MSRFRPGWLPTLLVFILFPLMVWLGFWQLDRAEEKRLLMAASEARRLMSPLPMQALEQQPELAYTRLMLQGTFDSAHSVLLDNRTRGGVAGVELLQPFYDQPSGLWVLVNRGWLAWPDRRIAPQFATPESPQRLTGWVYLSPGEEFLLKQTDSSAWPKLVNAVDVPALWKQLGRGGAPFQVRLEPGAATYQADWPIVAMDPQKHLGYAVQWFAMALALLVLFIYLGIRNARDRDDEFSPEPD
jgi:cytochrome oxidase assembly protein ShyY1